MSTMLLVAFGLVAIGSVLRLVLFFTAPKDCSESKFDYTKWHRNNLYNDMSLHDLNQKAAQFAKDHPFKDHNLDVTRQDTN